VVLTNDDLARLTRYVDIGRTPVVIGNTVEWKDAREWEASRDEFLTAFEQWRGDWESLDTNRYLSHYGTEFRSDGKDRAGWIAHKRKVNAGKSWVKVGVSQMSLFAYPGTAPMMMVTFDQDYRSSNLSNRTKKRQYWVREGSRWRIAHESVVS
jgi:hypothetical protein